MASETMGNKRTMPDSQSLSDALSKVVLDQEKKNQKNKGKQPME